LLQRKELAKIAIFTLSQYYLLKKNVEPTVLRRKRSLLMVNVSSVLYILVLKIETVTVKETNVTRMRKICQMENVKRAPLEKK